LRTVLKVALGVVLGVVVLFGAAVAVAVMGNIEESDKVTKEVAEATSQVVIEAPPSVTWKGTIGGVEHTGQGPSVLDVPNTGSDTAKSFKALVQKTTPGDDLLTVILNVDGEESAREWTRDVDSEIHVHVTLTLKK
jgi:hypothetical protein